MKYTTAILALGALAASAQDLICTGPPNTNNATYAINGIYMEKNFNWADLKSDFDKAIGWGYTHFFIGFYMQMYGCRGGCDAWEALAEADRSAVLADVHAAGGKIILSAGGPGESFEYMIKHGNQQAFADDATAYAQKWGYDGVDLACKLSGSGTIPSVWANNGSFVDMAKTFGTAAHAAGFSSENIGVSAPAPYFSKWLVQDSDGAAVPENNLAYVASPANSAQPWFFGGPVVELMFDENNNYMQYDDIFTDNVHYDPYYGNFGNGSSVAQVNADSGIELSRLAVLKPVDEDESSVRDGYIPFPTLGQMGCRANTEIGWNGGFVGWTWNGQDTSLVQDWSNYMITPNCSPTFLV